MMKAPLHKQAFSLVELSIVLVILGLLTGGVLTGQNLIRAAELRAVTTEYQTYQTAVMTFRDKYFALPGDMRNATDFWGEKATCADRDVADDGSYDDATCNGNGDGILETRAWNNAEDLGNEVFTFWQHLAKASLVAGSYSGNQIINSNIRAKLGWNVPQSKFNQAGWQCISSQGAVPNPGDNFFYDKPNGNYCYFGAPANWWVTREAVLTPEEAWNIDTKIDDSKPATGKLTSLVSCTNVSDATDMEAEYLLTSTDTLCAFQFIDAF